MASKEKACKHCKMIYEGSSCPNCQSTDSIDSFKGKVTVLNVENSEIAKSAGIKGKGVFALRLR
jgi:DNA-directed RNA polymerase subunit E"